MNDATITALTEVELLAYAEKITTEVITLDDGDLDLTDAGRDFMEANKVSPEDRAKLTSLIKDLINNGSQEAPTQEDLEESPEEATSVEAETTELSEEPVV